MKIELTKDAEARRVAEHRNQRQSSWGIFKSTSLVEAARKAKDLGWKEDKVQLRSERVAEDVVEYYVEPYERGCGCKGILHYKDFFD